MNVVPGSQDMVQMLDHYLLILQVAGRPLDMWDAFNEVAHPGKLASIQSYAVSLGFVREKGSDMWVGSIMVKITRKGTRYLRKKYHNRDLKHVLTAMRV